MARRVLRLPMGTRVGLLAGAVAIAMAGCGPAQVPGPSGVKPVLLPAQAQGAIAAMSFPTALDGWIAVASSAPGHSTTTQSILSTTTGGSTWRQSWSGAAIPFFSTSQGSDHGWVLTGSSPACGDARSNSAECPSSSLLATSDAGASWQELPAPPVRLSQVAFATPDVGLAASSPSCAANASLTATPCPGEVLLTTDAGKRWKVALRSPGLVAAIAAQGDALWAITGMTGLASKAPGASSPQLSVLRSLDDGASWSRVATLGPLFQVGPGLQGRLLIGPDGDMWFSYLEQDSCAMHGCAVGGFESLDGGLTWRANGAPDPTPAADCGDFAPPGSVAISPAGAVFGTYQRNLATCQAPAASLSEEFNGTWHPVHEWNFFSPRELIFASPAAGYAASGAALLATRDGGVSWTQVWPTPTPADGLDAISQSTAFGFGTQGSTSAILRTTDSGRTWNVVSQLPTRVLALDMDSARVGFTAGAGVGSQAQTFTLYRTQDGARNWALIGKGFPLQGWELLGLWLNPSGNGVGAVNGTESGAGLAAPTGFFAATDGARRWRPEGTVAHGFDLLSSAAFSQLQNGSWLGLAEVNQGRGSELLQSLDLGRTWSALRGAPGHLVALRIGARGALTGATMGTGASDQLRLYGAASVDGRWKRMAGPLTLVQDGSAGAAEVVSLTASNAAWLLAAGTVWETVNGGATWRLA